MTSVHDMFSWREKAENLQFLSVRLNSVSHRERLELLLSLFATDQLLSVDIAVNDDATPRVFQQRQKRQNLPLPAARMALPGCCSEGGAQSMMHYPLDSKSARRACCLITCATDISTEFYGTCIRKNLSHILDPSCLLSVRLPAHKRLQEFRFTITSSSNVEFARIMPQLCLTELPRVVNMSHMDMPEINKLPFANLPADTDQATVEVLDISHNRMTFYDLAFLSPFLNLRKLMLGGNYVTNSSLRALCGHVPRLVVLSLDHLEIKTFDELKLGLCLHLEYLDLSSNEIRILHRISLNPYLKINILDLSNNHISLIKHSALQMLEKVLRHGFIDLSNNRLLCTCHTGTLNAISALQHKELIAVNLQDMMCFDQRKNDLMFIEKVDVEKLRDECVPEYIWHMFYGFMSFLTLFAFIALFRYLRRKRYQLKNIYHKLRYERFAPTSYQFTCYVSHAGRDARWVQSVLVPRLEEMHGFELCVPDRDFCTQNEIDETLEAMTLSHSVLVVLSREFLENYKCRFELAQAFEQRRRHGKRVFAIKLGNIPRSVLQQDAKALELVDGDRCLEWPVTDTNPNACRYRQQLAKKKDKFWCALSQKLYKGLKPRQS